MLELKQNTTLVAARDREYNFPITCYDDYMGPLWLFGDDSGIRMIIRAQSFEAAWGIMLDESKPIDESEVPEAYGFYGDNAALKLRQAAELADAGEGEHPNLIEGYEYQPNSSGTGIVSVSHYAWLREMTREDAKEKVRLVIRSDDCEVTQVTFEISGPNVKYATDEGEQQFHSFSVLRDVGQRIREMEEQYWAVQAEVVWSQ